MDWVIPPYHTYAYDTPHMQTFADSNCVGILVIKAAVQTGPYCKTTSLQNNRTIHAYPLPLSPLHPLDIWATYGRHACGNVLKPAEARNEDQGSLIGCDLHLLYLIPSDLNKVEQKALKKTLKKLANIPVD
jgi:hypothetical protein